MAPRSLTKNLNTLRQMLTKTTRPLSARWTQELARCNTEAPCGNACCPFCSHSYSTRVASLLYPLGFDEALAFTLVVQDVPETEFHHNVNTGIWGTDHNCGDAHDMSQRFARAINRHLDGAPLVMLPDVEWNPVTQVFSIHYHCVIRTQDTPALQRLRQHRDVPYSAAIQSLFKMIPYGLKTPLLRPKHYQELRTLRDTLSQRDQLVLAQRTERAQRSLVLWKALRPYPLFLNLSKTVIGPLRSTTDITPSLHWRGMHTKA